MVCCRMVRHGSGDVGRTRPDRLRRILHLNVGRLSWPSLLQILASGQEIHPRAAVVDPKPFLGVSEMPPGRIFLNARFVMPV